MDIVAHDFEFLLFFQMTMLAYLGFWVFALIDMIRSDFKDPNQKLIWALLLLIIPFFGTFIYLSMSRRTKVQYNSANQYFEKRITFRK